MTRKSRVVRRCVCVCSWCVGVCTVCVCVHAVCARIMYLY